MEILAVQPYYKILRKLSSTGQQEIKEKRNITLYANHIGTKHHRFSLDEVQDISFRQVGSKGGLLYLHTLQGMFSYPVETSPGNFMEIVKKVLKTKGSSDS